MSNEEAIEILRKNKPISDTRRCGIELCQAVDIAIEALEAQIPKKVKPDYISKESIQDLSDFIDSNFSVFNNEEELRDFLQAQINNDIIEWALNYYGE